MDEPLASPKIGPQCPPTCDPRHLIAKAICAKIRSSVEEAPWANYHSLSLRVCRWRGGDGTASGAVPLAIAVANKHNQ